MEDIKLINEFLENAKNLEVSIYTQKKIISNLSNKIDNLKTNRNITSKPIEPSPVNSPNEIARTFIHKFFYFLKIPCLLFAAWIMYILITPALTTYPQMIFNIILGVLFAFICSFMNVSTMKSKNDKVFNESMTRYKNQLELYKKSNVEEDKRVKEVNLQKQYLSLQLNELNKTLENTQQTLKTYYNNNSLVYPKYLNLLGITQILEYLQSGRCDTLLGPHGAYNLYESEIRMNRVINNLNQVIHHLNEIKENQFLIYEEICRGNEIAEKILGEITDCNAYLKGIEINSAVSSYNSQIAAYNSSICAFNTSF